MAFHSPLPAPGAGLGAQTGSAANGDLSADILLDHCRRLSGARMTGASDPADATLSALRASVPLEEAYRIFGLLYDLVANAQRRGPGAFLWHPVGARRRSGDEQWLVTHALDALVSRSKGEAAPASIATLAESYCMAAERNCSLHTAMGEPCARICPFSGTRIAAAAQGDT